LQPARDRITYADENFTAAHEILILSARAAKMALQDFGLAGILIWVDRAKFVDAGALFRSIRAVRIIAHFMFPNNLRGGNAHG
jgi:hypothetical protein